MPGSAPELLCDQPSSQQTLGNLIQQHFLSLVCEMG